MKERTKIIMIVIVSILIAVAVFMGAPKLFESGKEKILEMNSEEDVASVYASLPPQAQKLYLKQSDNLAKPVPERLVELDQLKIGCFGADTIMRMSASDTNLGGQCCGVLQDIEAYEVQLQAL